MRDQTGQVLDEALKASPPVVVTFYSSVLAMPIEKWVAAATLIYVVLQVFLLVRDHIITRRRRITDEVKNEAE